MSLNGSTDDAHTSSYVDEFHESCADSLNRIDRTLDLLDRILYLGLFIPIGEEKQHLFREIDRSTKGHQNLLAESDVEPRCLELYRRVVSQLEKVKQIALPRNENDPN